MVRVSKEKAAANRETLVVAAGRLFRARGVDGVGVAEVAKEAGLTHGALYAHFPSKEKLAAEALTLGMENCLAQMKASAGGEPPNLAAYLDFLLSPQMRDALDTGCPMTASGSEIARGSVDVSQSFTEGFGGMLAALEEVMPGDRPAEERRGLALMALAAELGAIIISRGVQKADPAFADEVLDSIRSGLDTVMGNGSKPARA